MIRMTIIPATFAFALALILVETAEAQRIDLGADVVSRYVWRGVDFGESVSIQPALALQVGGLEIGSWASYAAGPASAGFNEHDLWISYSLPVGTGSLTFGATDYYFPAPVEGDYRDPSTEFFNFAGGGRGAHWIEPFVSATGPAPFPLTFYASFMAHNDPDRSVYLEASLPWVVQGTDMGLALGGVPHSSDFYGTAGAALVNLTLTAERSIPITEYFSLPMSVSYILNPYAERSFLVFGVRL
jgi:hypothetical protein